MDVLPGDIEWNADLAAVPVGHYFDGLHRSAGVVRVFKGWHGGLYDVRTGADCTGLIGWRACNGA